ncbi:MAG: hypothetical protein NZ602_06880 [Thermoguttaceae bacterium]|nr:hypothetical protein [Thermoguttaceae bacterium]MDW8038514.1 hypothetical protein [Thermoguttaceae bacterium]
MNRILPLFQGRNPGWGSHLAAGSFLMLVPLPIGYLLGAICLGGIPLSIGGTGWGVAVWAAEAAPRPQPIRLAESSPAKSEPTNTPSALQKQLQRELGEAGVSEEENPLLSILQQMREVEVLLGQGQTGPRTQQIQKQILAELDRLIQQAQNSALAQAKVSAKGKPQAGSADSPQGPTSPAEPKEGLPGTAKQSPAKSPPGSSPEEKATELQQLRSLLHEVWGLLPPTQRQQMLETPVEEFLPKYKLLIIDYFRRLAELRAKEK